MRRRISVEAVFWQLKRPLGPDQFPLRGFEEVGGEWNLLCTAHNML